MQTRMKLGDYTFAMNPSIYTPPNLLTPRKRIATVETFESLAVFNWGTTIVGMPWPLEWRYITKSQYDQFEALFLADGQLPFDPAREDGKTYLVELLSLTGKYMYKLNNPGGELWYKDARLELLILEEIA